MLRNLVTLLFPGPRAPLKRRFTALCGLQKESKYEALANSHVFRPVALETLAAMNSSASDFLSIVLVTTLILDRISYYHEAL